MEQRSQSRHLHKVFLWKMSVGFELFQERPSLHHLLQKILICLDLPSLRLLRQASIFWFQFINDKLLHNKDFCQARLAYNWKNKIPKYIMWPGHRDIWYWWLFAGCWNVKVRGLSLVFALILKLLWLEEHGKIGGNPSCLHTGWWICPSIWLWRDIVALLLE